VQRKIRAHGSAVEEGVERGDENEPGLMATVSLIDYECKQPKRTTYPWRLVVLPESRELLGPRDAPGRWDLAAVSTADVSGGRKHESPQDAGAF